ncbi:probable strigolactone esterase DAD2 [Zingiber officinale]|uniref:probable strigolactone esterase DAD2 n=1 Tax=Zingiber officinale TaxID=94328 RepID=UPI001C4D06F1|nr:probable strigolactone esterase DAD2 [Zingiber officinale]
MGSGNGDSSKLLDILNARMVGDGDRVLVLSHGFGTDQSAWNGILPFFLRDYRVVLYDLVFAGSVNPDHFDFRRYATLDAYVDDLLSLLDALSVDRCFFVGHSVSAMIGILAAIRRPRLFLKLILVGASPRFLNDHEAGYHGGFEREKIEEVFAAMEANYEAWVQGFAPLAVGADVPAAVTEYGRTLSDMRPDISLFVSRAVFNSDLRGFLGLVLPPCVVVQTANDMSVPPSVTSYLRAHLGGRTTVELLGEEGHMPHLSHPAAFVQVLHRALTIDPPVAPAH